MIRPTRTISCVYEDATGEHTIAVSLRRDGLGHLDWVIETDLSDVPDDERESVEQQAIDGWMDADEKAHSDARAPTRRRGGPSGASGKNLLTEVKLRAEDDEIEAWDDAARKLGVTRTAFLRTAANSLADDTLGSR